MISRPLKIACAILILALSLSARSAQAQGTISLSALTIELWPEFDRPSVLVILKGTLAAGVPLPAQVTIRLPAASGGPHAVAAEDSTGQLLNTQYTTSQSGDAIAVNITTDFPTFHVEYYDPGLTMAGEARDYTFQWTTDYPVSAVVVRVQEPVDARGLTAEPALTAAGAADFGLNYYSASLGQLSAGQSLSFHLQYSKSTSTLSAEVVNKDAAVPLATPVVAGSPSARTDYLPILLAAAGGLGLLMIGFGVWSMVRNRGEAGMGHSRRRRRRAPSAEAEPLSAPRPEADAPARFCTQCGQPVLPGDRFCRNCGAPVRS
jgi:hypothetical protein